MSDSEKPIEPIFSPATDIARGRSNAIGYSSVRIHAPLPADHPFYANIGRVASEWSHVEHMLDLIIWHLADVPDPQGACITAQIMGVGPRCKAIISLGRIKGLPVHFLKKFKTLVNDSFYLADLRARVVHDPWYLETQGDVPGQFRSMPYTDPRFGISDVSQAEIDDTLGKTKALFVRAEVLRVGVLDQRWT